MIDWKKLNDQVDEINESLTRVGIGNEGPFYFAATENGEIRVWCNPERARPFIFATVGPVDLTLEQADDLARTLTERVTDEKVRRAELGRSKGK